MVHEAIIIGSGVAGLTAGIYLGRFKRSPLVIEGMLPGGQLMTTGAVENWPGIKSVQGPTLMNQIREHAQSCGATFVADEIASVDFSTQPLTVITKHDKVLKAKSVIIATGASPRKLGVPGEKEYWGQGVNSCATCDAPLYKDKEVVVVGGGNSAVAESFALSTYAKKVTIVQVQDALTATDPLTDKVLAAPNIDVLYNQKVVEIKGNGAGVSYIVIEDQIDKTLSDFSTEGVFIAIGMIPTTKPFEGKLDVSEHGYLVRAEGAKASYNEKPLANVFLAGDVSDYRYRQAITASGQGCSAALECERYLRDSA